MLVLLPLLLLPPGLCNATKGVGDAAGAEIATVDPKTQSNRGCWALIVTGPRTLG
jgi:hypothetical protein